MQIPLKYEILVPEVLSFQDFLPTIKSQTEYNDRIKSYRASPGKVILRTRLDVIIILLLGYHYIKLLLRYSYIILLLCYYYIILLYYYYINIILYYNYVIIL